MHSAAANVAARLRLNQRDCECSRGIRHPLTAGTRPGKGPRSCQVLSAWWACPTSVVHSHAVRSRYRVRRLEAIGPKGPRAIPEMACRENRDWASDAPFGCKWETPLSSRSMAAEGRSCVRGASVRVRVRASVLGAGAPAVRALRSALVRGVQRASGGALRGPHEPPHIGGLLTVGGPCQADRRRPPTSAPVSAIVGTESVSRSPGCAGKAPGVRHIHCARSHARIRVDTTCAGADHSGGRQSDRHHLQRVAGAHIEAAALRFAPVAGGSLGDVSEAVEAVLALVLVTHDRLVHADRGWSGYRLGPHFGQR